MKKAVSLMVISMLAISGVIGCSKNNNEAASPTNSPAPAAATPAVDKSPITLELSGLYSTFVQDNPVWKKIAEKTGVTMVVKDPVTGDRNQKFDLWLASKGYPEDGFVIQKTTQLDKYAQAGAIIPLEGLIDKYGPNIKKQFGKYYNLLKDPKDGHIYSIYSPNPVSETIANAQGSFAIRYDVLKEAGYPQIKTLDQLFDVLQKYYKAHPTSADGKSQIAWSGIGGNEGQMILNAPSLAASGNQEVGNGGIGLRVDNGVVSSNLVSDSNKKYYAFLNKLQMSGMLDPEYFTMTQDASVTKLAENRVLAGFFPSWFLPGSNNTIRASGKLDKMFAPLPITFEENMKENHINSVTPTRVGWSWVVSSKSKHPERVIQLYDYLFSDEGQILLNWGIEGKHYEVVNGKRQVKADYQAQMNADPNIVWKEMYTPFVGATFAMSAGVKLGDGDYAATVTRDSVNKNYDEMTKEVLSKYGKELWADFLPKVEFIPGYVATLSVPDEIKSENAKVQSIWLKESPKIIYAKSLDEFNKQWDDYKAQMDKAGLPKVVDAMNKAWKEYTDVYDKAIGK
ncbi:extracellular solute-binding protein [Paenibacillus sp. HJGM_3]|uniref:extracellular solute-binding protein n=1 Tax=Paenibacillus sp. HJGM_3 TaxID=3379816 RepID=UPI00385FE607